MKKIDFIELANGALRLVETTERNGNGYPRKLMNAIIGFDTYEEAEELAKANGLTVISLHRRDGWQLWERGSNAYSAICIDAENYGDDYRSYNDEDSYFEEEIKPRLEECSNLDELKKICAMAEKTIDALQTIDEDEEQVITIGGNLFEVAPTKTMQWENDGHYYAIGVIDYNVTKEEDDE